MSLVAILWIKIFCCCGRGGYSVKGNMIDDRPWHIVVPALGFFAISSIFEIVYAVMLQAFNRNHSLCDPSIQHQNCGHSEEILYKILFYCTILKTICWLIALTIMVVRVLRAPDFKVVIHNNPSKPKEFLPIEHSGDNSKENFIFINRDFPPNKSVRF